MKPARVIKSIGNQCTLETSEGRILPGILKGKLRLKESESTNPIAVGDYVHIEWDATAQVALITEVLPRHNYIIRKSNKLSKQTQILASNIDNAVLIVTPLFPKTSTGFVDRYIATAEAYHIKTILVFNKSDVFDGESAALIDDYVAIYEPLGYTCLRTSAKNSTGIEELKLLLKDKTSLVAGHSGVGKTSLINLLAPGVNLRTGKISKQHGKGMHTTTFAEMLHLPFGGYIIDTPGIRELGTVDFEKAEISHYFVEMQAMMHQCKFHNCLHLNEAQCAVKQAVEVGTIHPMRYYNYLSILNNEDNFN